MAAAEIDNNNQKFNELIAAVPLDQKIVFGVIAGILLIIGIILTFRGKKCFRHLISGIVFIAAGLLPLFFIGLHKKLRKDYIICHVLSLCMHYLCNFSFLWFACTQKQQLQLKLMCF